MSAHTARQCPTCQAKPGEPCTQPTSTGRRPVTWVHLARELPERIAATREDDELRP